jgi:hypothetical protein
MNEISGQRAYEQLQKLLIDKKDKLRIMERQINLDIQMAYFEKAAKSKKELPDVETLLLNAQQLFNPIIDIETKRTLLHHLASIEDVRCFRILEKYMKKPDVNLADWAYLAYQESLMMMESALTEEDLVYISSGLGGKGSKLRYFVVMLSENMKDAFSNPQQSLILKEVIFHFNKVDAEFEEHSFHEAYFMFSCLIPIDIHIPELFNSVLKQINELGGILNEHFLITNVKRLSIDEVEELIEKRLEMNKTDE